LLRDLRKVKVSLSAELTITISVEDKIGLVRNPKRLDIEFGMRSRGYIGMKSKKHRCDRDEGCRSSRRDFNVTFAALLISACASLSLASMSSPDRGRWILNERDR
jgi:hypothetical protein